MAKVLLIEDDPILLKMYGEKFLINGFDVITAYGGEEGLAKAKKEQPDFIIVDLMMPKVDGSAVINELKGSPQTEKIPVAIFTVIPQDSSNIDDGLLTKIVYYWMKDKVKPSQMVEQVKKYLKAH